MSDLYYLRKLYKHVMDIRQRGGIVVVQEMNGEYVFTELKKKSVKR